MIVHDHHHWLTRSRAYPLARDIISMLIYAIQIKHEEYLQRGEIYISFVLCGCHHDPRHIENIVHFLALPAGSYYFNYRFNYYIHYFNHPGFSTFKHNKPDALSNQKLPWDPAEIRVLALVILQNN